MTEQQEQGCGFSNLAIRAQPLTSPHYADDFRCFTASSQISIHSTNEVTSFIFGE